MKIESRAEKVIFLGLVPITAAVAGALAAAVFTGDSCQLAPGTDFVSILGSSSLSNAEKLQALEMYREITDRPWQLVRSLTSLLLISSGVLTVALFSRLARK